MCFSETIAPPRVSPRQPASSISRHAWWPGGLAKVDPPVRARIGCEASRAARISSIWRAIAAGSPGFAAEPRGDEDPVRIDLGVAVGQPHPIRRDRVPDAAAVDDIGRDQHILELATIGAGIGSEPAADRAGDAGEEFEPGDPGLGGGQRDIQIERPGSGLDQLRPGIDCGKAAPEPHGDPLDAAVAHQQVRTDPDRRDRNIAPSLMTKMMNLTNSRCFNPLPVPG